MSRFQRVKRQWEASDHYQQLMSGLSSVVIPSDIRNVVAFACSSMNRAGEERGPSDAQHALMLAVRDFLAQNGATDLELFAQDPIYTDIDEQVLGKLGMSVLDDPRAFLKVDELSVVISVSPDIPVRDIIADIARPAMLFWNRVRVGEEQQGTLGHSAADHTSGRVSEMIKNDYTELAFPADQDYFDDLTIYIRKGSSEL